MTHQSDVNPIAGPARRGARSRGSVGIRLVLALALAAPLSAQVASREDLRVLAEVAGRAIRVADLELIRQAERRAALSSGALGPFTSEAARNALDRLIDTRRLATEARARGLTDRPDVQRRIDAVVDDLLARTLLDETAATIPVDEPALRSYYDAHPDEFRKEGRVKARHVVVATEPEAVAILGRLRRNSDFAALARAHNIDSTKSTGGDLGWVSRGVMVAPFDAALFSLRPGETSGIVRTAFGFHIVQALEIEPPVVEPWARVQDAVRRRVIERSLDALRAELVKKHPARVNAEMMRALR
jgi:peptidyl-prolyl cis-trans isomerase C